VDYELEPEMWAKEADEEELRRQKAGELTPTFVHRNGVVIWFTVFL
jgi:hypothetical protein